MVVDIGTSSIKTSLFDLKGNLLPEFSIKIEHQIISKNDGTSEQNSEFLANKVENSIDLILEKISSLDIEILGVGLDCMASTLVGLDKKGLPITPTFTYADTRSNNQVKKINENFDLISLHQETGVIQHTSYIPSKILWIKEENPNLYNKIEKFVDFSSYLYSRWFENYNFKSSYSISSWSGLLDKNKLEWHSKLLDYLELSPNNFPELNPCTFFYKGLKKSFRNRWQTLKNSNFYLSVGDGIAANIGSGCINSSKIALTIGSTGAMRILIDKHIKIPKGLWAYRFLTDQTLLGGSFSEGGNLIQWAYNNLKLPKIEKLNHYLSDSIPGDHGIEVLPFLLGERSMGWTNDSKGTISGLSFSNSPLEIMQSILESLCYRFFLLYKELLPFVNSKFEIIASGGAIKNFPWWIQTMSDVLGNDIKISDESQDTSRGTALIVSKSLGEISDLDEIDNKYNKIYHPNKSNYEIHQKLISSHVKLYDKIIDN